MLKRTRLTKLGGRSIAVAVWACTAVASAQTPVSHAEPSLGPTVYTVFPSAFVAHGIAADDRVMFVNEAVFTPQVHVLDRLTGERLGSLPAPEGGFSTPIYIRIRGHRSWGQAATSGEVLVLDAFRPDQAGRVPTFLRVYRYEYGPANGFHAELVASHRLPMNTNPPAQLPNGFVFPASFDFLPNGDVVVADLVSIWVSDASLEGWRMALISPQFAPGPYCSTVHVNGEDVPGFYMKVRDANWNPVVVPYQMRLEGLGPVLPPLKGVAYIDVADRIAFQRVATPGGIFWIDRAALLDTTTPPFMKPFDVLVAPEIGLSDLAGDVAYDHFHPDSEWLYWQRTPSAPGQTSCPGVHPYSEKPSPIYRVSVLTGKVELVAESWRLYDFPTVLSVIPPLGAGSPFTHLFSSNVREEWMTETNNLATATTLFPPTIVPMVLVHAY